MGLTSLAFDKTFDLIVVGAGVAGVAAALEAARGGLKTALVEKTVLVGGLATTGLINIYLPLCDGNGRQVTYGVAEELLRLSVQYGPGDVPAGWPDGEVSQRKERYQTPFSPASFVLALDEVLDSAGVDLWLDTLVCAPILRGDRIAGVEVENKSGRGALRAACVIDASGDADVAHRAGVPCVEGDNWLSIWAMQTSLERARKVAAQPERFTLLDEIRLGADAFGTGAVQGGEHLHGTQGDQVTRFVLDSHHLLREHYRAKQSDGMHTRHTLFPVTLPAMAQYRTIRRIEGRATLSGDEYGLRVPSSVGLVADWRKPGYVWEIPYETLLPREVTGLLAAGRCMSSGGDAWEVMRVIPAAALTGQVAGVAARLAVAHRVTPDQLDLAILQAELLRTGIPLHLEDVGLLPLPR
jgi:hypothetical protein